MTHQLEIEWMRRHICMGFARDHHPRPKAIS
jgi:hypothetical protein